jgi:hypothetical protein
MRMRPLVITRLLPATRATLRLHLARSVTDHRWWGVEELRRSDEVVWPRDLASLLATLLAGPPGAVIEID